MKQRYRVFLRPWGVYYCEDLTTKKQETLKTRDKDEAYRIVAARNENEEAPAFSLHLARVYWKAGDPAGATRTWQHVMDEIPKLKQDETRHRWLTAIKDKALDSVRKLVVLETQAEHFLKVLQDGSVSTNIYLRRIHNFALDMNWLPWPVLPKKRWPQIKFKEKRAIKWEEHQAIVSREQNTERKAFYQLAWHLGAAQSDMRDLQSSFALVSSAHIYENETWLESFVPFGVMFLRDRPARCWWLNGRAAFFRGWQVSRILTLRLRPAGSHARSLNHFCPSIHPASESTSRRDRLR